MKLILQILLFLLIASLNECKNIAPCNQLDSSCNPVSSLLLENLIRNSKNILSFTPSGGTYKFDQFVIITSKPNLSVIRYTLDGSEPSCTNGYIFNNPIPIIGAKTHTLKAAACNENQATNTRTDEYSITISPLMAPNLRFWYSADSIGTQNGMEVKVWNDYSGNENHLYTSSLSLSNPTLVANALNGRPSVRFTATQKQFMNTKAMKSYTGSKAGTGVMVLRKYSFQAEEVYFSIGFISNFMNSRNWRGNLLNPSLCSSLSPTPLNCGGAAITTLPTSGYHIIIFTNDSAGNIQYFFDGVNDGLSTLPTPTAFSPANTMFLGTGLNVINFLDAEILEVLFFEQGFDANGVNIVNCMIQNKYGLQVSTSCP